MFTPSRIASPLVFSAIALFCAGSVLAQDFPTKPIRIIVANSPGTAPDIMGRIIGPEMSKILGQPIVIENKAGASQMLGYEYVAKQVPADGYTLLVTATSTLTTFPLFTRDLRFDPLKDLPPIIGLAEGRFILGTASKFSWKTLNELAANARANPGKLNYGASSPIVRLSTEVLIQGLGIDMLYVPYSGGALYLQALAAGEIHMGFVGEATAVALGERFRVLAVTGGQRRPPYLEVPTFAELGHPGIRGLIHQLNAPAGVPKGVLEKLFVAASRSLQKPEIKALFAKNGWDVVEKTSDAAARELAEEARLYAEIAKKIGIKPQ